MIPFSHTAVPSACRFHKPDKALQQSCAIQSIISELNNVSSQNVEIIADFMYKNSFDQTINELNKRNFKPIEMLRVISLYD